MAVRNIVAAIAALAASAGAGGAYFANTSATKVSAEPSPHATVLVETKEAPAANESSVKVESGGKKQRVDVQRSKSGSVVQVENGGKARRVEVQHGKTDDGARPGNDVQVERKGGALHVKVGDLVVDTQGTH